jgi:hypothetical protein
MIIGLFAALSSYSLGLAPASAVPPTRDGNETELTLEDLFSLPDWQQKSVAVSGFALGMTRSQASQLAQTSGLRLTTNVAPKTVGEVKAPCTQASCGVYQVNGNWIGVDLYFDAADQINTIKVSVPDEADPAVRKVNITRQFKGLTFQFFNHYSDTLRKKILGPAESKEKPERPGAAITHIEYDYLRANLIMHTKVDKRDDPPKPFDLEVDFVAHPSVK